MGESEVNDITAPQDVGQLDRRDIPGWEGLYAVTRDGRVWAHPRKWATGAGGQIRRSHPGSWLAQMRAPNGYMRVNLHGNRVRVSVSIHRLVALAWLPNDRALPQINHIDGRKDNNCVENLEWCTASQNRRHALRNGFRASPAFVASVRANVRHAQLAARKLTQQQADSARERVRSGESKAMVSRSLGISSSTLYSILKGSTYAG